MWEQFFENNRNLHLLYVVLCVIVPNISTRTFKSIDLKFVSTSRSIESIAN